jgi:hypothetical protein
MLRFVAQLNDIIINKRQFHGSISRKQDSYRRRHAIQTPFFLQPQQFSPL